MPPDPKTPTRVKDPQLLAALHIRWTACALCAWGRPLVPIGGLKLSLHHIHKHRDDVKGNLIMLCGDGVTGHHGLIESNDTEACAFLARYIRVMRPDTFQYLTDLFKHQGGAVAADAWLTRLATEKEEHSCR